MRISKPTKRKKWRPPTNAKSAIARALEQMVAGESINVMQVSPDEAQRIRAVIHIRRKRGSLTGAFKTSYSPESKAIRIWRTE